MRRCLADASARTPSFDMLHPSPRRSHRKQASLKAAGIKRWLIIPIDQGLLGSALNELSMCPNRHSYDPVTA